MNLQVRATNTNVDDGINLLASVTLPLARADLVGELLHMGKDGADGLDRVGAIDVQPLNLALRSTHVTQTNVVDGTALSVIDLLTSEHLVAERLDIGLLGQLDEQVNGLISGQVLGEIEEDLVIGGLELASESLEAGRVLAEVLQDDLGSLGVAGGVLGEIGVIVSLESLPSSKLGGGPFVLSVSHFVRGTGDGNKNMVYEEVWRDEVMKQK